VILRLDAIVSSTIRDRLPAFLPVASIIALSIGVVVTVYGFYGLAMNVGEGSIWRKSDEYLVMFFGLLLAIAVLGIWRGPLVGGLLVASFIAVVSGVAVQTLVIMTLALSAYVLGRLLLRAPVVAVTDSLLVGIVVFGSLLGLLVHVPVNTSGTWGILFALPILIGWRHVQTLWAPIKRLLSHNSRDAHCFLLHCAIFAAALLHFLVSLMPEVGHDALAMHLFIPVQVAYNKAWHFDAGTYVWAVMPMLVDWLYTAGYLFAGETGARLVNVGGIVLLAAMVYRLGRWAGADEVPAIWAVLLLLVTPLTFTESSSLFIEGMWSAMVLGGTLALMRLVTNSDEKESSILLVGLLLGGALASKAVTFTIMPILGLVVIVGYRNWLSKATLSVSIRAVLLLLAVGVIPYVIAYATTGNPVFPFFNAFFQSPLYPHENFSAPKMFAQGVAWDTLYQMTFVSWKYLESTPGASGFQWLLLVMPALVVLAMAGHRRALLLALVAVGWVWLAFGQIAYLRYVLPSFGLACVVVATALSVPAVNQSWTRHVWTAVAVVTVGLNLLHFHSGTHYGEINLQVIVDPRAREEYIERNVPVRWAASFVNTVNFAQAPVAFFSAPLTAGLTSDALYVSWYNTRFAKAVQTATNGVEMSRLLRKNHVKYVVVDDRWDQARLFPLVKEVTVEVARNQTVSVRRLNNQYR